jgi:hypothetical protein
MRCVYGVCSFFSGYYDEYAEHSCTLEPGKEYINPSFNQQYAVRCCFRVLLCVVLILNFCVCGGRKCWQN